jgi:hypothetical protein
MRVRTIAWHRIKEFFTILPRPSGSTHHWQESAMGTLTNADRRSSFIFGWQFWLRTDDGRQIRVLVDDKALPDEAATDVEVTNKYRPRIEEIALAKYTAGQFEADGAIRIRA